MTEHPNSERLERMLAANRRHVATRPDIPAQAAPSERIAVVTCMDVRIDPLPLLGLHLGQAHVLRNAGARVTDDVLRSLVISQQALGTDAVILMPHTRCGVLGLDPGTLAPPGGAPAASALPLDFHAMDDLEEALAADLRRLQSCGWMPSHVELIGLILDIDTGLVRHLPGGQP